MGSMRFDALCADANKGTRDNRECCRTVRLSRSSGIRNVPTFRLLLRIPADGLRIPQRACWPPDQVTYDTTYGYTRQVLFEPDRAFSQESSVSRLVTVLR